MINTLEAERRALRGITSLLVCAVVAGAALLAGVTNSPARAEEKVLWTPPGNNSPVDITKLPQPPIDSKDSYIAFMTKNRPDKKEMLVKRYDRYLAVVRNGDAWRDKEKRAFLMAPREDFVLTRNLPRAYDHAFLDIGYGVTISGPHLVSRMTSVIDVQPGDKVLEIGTGSGYQSSVLSYLTDKVYTIEIIEPLAERTSKTYEELAKEGYPEFSNIRRKTADGYYGWQEFAPFNKIIVTAGIDHIPPPLLQQLAVGGIMVIPVGPFPQVVLKVQKVQDKDGNITITREDIYGGRKKVGFVPFTKQGGGNWSK
jgi:protein-L-isoaspartate(D-aspartate) O-methyltransferase